MKRAVEHARPGPKGPGFTLLELVLVMVIIVIALSLVVPKLSGFSRGRALHDVAGEFVALTRMARSQAVSNGTIYRITIDSQNGHCQLTRQDGTNFVAIPSSLEQSVQLPQGMRIQMKRDESQQPRQSNNAIGSGTAPPQPTPNDSIDFFPSGRTQPAQIVLTGRDGDQLVIECPSAAEDFGILSKTNS